MIQEACLEATERIQEYVRQPKTSFYLWLRFITAQKLMQFHRRHLGAQSRDPRREVSLYHGSVPEASSVALAEQLVGKRTSASQAAMRAEVLIRLQDALNSMDPVDREVLTLRHLEQLSNNETAEALGLHVLAQGRTLPAAAALDELLGDLVEGIARAGGAGRWASAGRAWKRTVEEEVAAAAGESSSAAGAQAVTCRMRAARSEE